MSVAPFAAVARMEPLRKSAMTADQAFGGLPSGHSGSWSFGSNHDAASDRQICALGRWVIAVSRHPIRSKMVPEPALSATTCDPHCVQKYLVLPGEESNPLSRPSPRVQRNRSRGTLVTVENAEPCALRQVAQWQ